VPPNFPDPIFRGLGARAGTSGRHWGWSAATTSAAQVPRVECRYLASVEASYPDWYLNPWPGTRYGQNVLDALAGVVSLKRLLIAACVRGRDGDNGAGRS